MVAYLLFEVVVYQSHYMFNDAIDYAIDRSHARPADKGRAPNMGQHMRLIIRITATLRVLASLAIAWQSCRDPLTCISFTAGHWSCSSWDPTPDSFPNPLGQHDPNRCVQSCKLEVREIVNERLERNRPVVGLERLGSPGRTHPPEDAGTVGIDLVEQLGRRAQRAPHPSSAGTSSSGRPSRASTRCASSRSRDERSAYVTTPVRSDRSTVVGNRGSSIREASCRVPTSGRGSHRAQESWRWRYCFREQLRNSVGLVADGVVPAAVLAGGVDGIDPSPRRSGLGVIRFRWLALAIDEEQVIGLELHDGVGAMVAGASEELVGDVEEEPIVLRVGSDVVEVLKLGSDLRFKGRVTGGVAEVALDRGHTPLRGVERDVRRRSDGFVLVEDREEFADRAFALSDRRADSLDENGQVSEVADLPVVDVADVVDLGV